MVQGLSGAAACPLPGLGEDSEPEHETMSTAHDESRHVALGRCPACGCGERSFLFESGDWIHEVPGSFSLMRCAACASAYPDPRPTRHALAAYYPEGYSAHGTPVRHNLFARSGRLARAWYALRRGVLRRHYGYEQLGGSVLLAQTVARVPPLRRRAAFSLESRLHPWRADGVLLDVGCGSGRYLDLMRALGWRVVGVDTSAEAVRQARETLGIEVHQGDLRSARLPGATFDAVTLSHVLEHVDDPVATLAEVRRITKPGGRIAIAVPNVHSLASSITGEHWVPLDTPRHLTNFTPRGLRAALDGAGLEVESLETSPRSAHLVSLWSLSKARGNASPSSSRAPRRFAVRDCAAAVGMTGAEWVLCAGGVAVGEEILAVARR